MKRNGFRADGNSTGCPSTINTTSGERGPVLFRIENDRLITEFPDARYRVRVRLKASNGVARVAECGNGPAAHMRLRLEASSEVRWSEGWVIQTETRFGPPQFNEPCRLPATRARAPGTAQRHISITAACS